MMKHRCLNIMLLCLLVVTFFSPVAFAAKNLTEDQALNVLVAQITKDKLYDSWTSLACLSFMTEDNTASYFDFAIYEKHSGACPGDPNTYPLVDRFRVNRATKKIYWNEPTGGNFVAYKQVLNARSTK